MQADGRAASKQQGRREQADSSGGEQQKQAGAADRAAGRGGRKKSGERKRGSRGSRRACPARAGSRWRGKDRRKDAAGDGKVGKRSPDLKWKHLTIRGGTAWWVSGRGKKGEGPEEANRRVEKWKDIGPSNVGGGVGGGGWIE
jgi:hypothetical protein